MADYKDNIVSSAITGIVNSADKAMSNTVNVGTNTADRGYTNANNAADRGYINSNPDAGGQPSGSPGGGYGGYSGGRRSYSSGKPASTKPTKEDQKKQQATLNNLGDIYGRKKKDLEKQAEAGLNVIKEKQRANNDLLAQQQIQIKKSSEWQPTQQKEQSTLTALRDRIGNSAYGSGIQDLMEGMSRVDDMNDVQLINAYKQSTDSAYNNWFQADTELVGDYNEALADAEQKMGDLLNQYQAALNNVNPIAAQTKNINKASKNVTAAAANKKALKAADDRLSSLKTKSSAANKALLGLVSGSKNAKYRSLQDRQSDAKNAYKQAKDQLASLRKGGATAAQIQKAQERVQMAKSTYQAATDRSKNYYNQIINKALNAKSSAKRDAAAKAQSLSGKVDSAKAALKKAQGKSTKAKGVSVGSGTEKVTLPKVNMNPSSAFSKLMANKAQNASAVNPLTKGYIRPDAAVTRLGGTRGAFNTADDANSGFADNLNAFRRV